MGNVWAGALQPPLPLLSSFKSSQLGQVRLIAPWTPKTFKKQLKLYKKKILNKKEDSDALQIEKCKAHVLIGTMNFSSIKCRICFLLSQMNSTLIFECYTYKLP